MIIWDTTHQDDDEVDVDWARRLEWLVIVVGLMTVALCVLHLEAVRLSPPTPARATAQGLFEVQK